MNVIIMVDFVNSKVTNDMQFAFVTVSIENTKQFFFFFFLGSNMNALHSSNVL